MYYIFCSRWLLRSNFKCIHTNTFFLQESTVQWHFMEPSFFTHSTVMIAVWWASTSHCSAVVFRGTNALWNPLSTILFLFSFQLHSTELLFLWNNHSLVNPHHSTWWCSYHIQSFHVSCEGSGYCVNPWSWEYLSYSQRTLFIIMYLFGMMFVSICRW